MLMQQICLKSCSFMGVVVKQNKLYKRIRIQKESESNFVMDIGKRTCFSQCF